jgi:hypothetical protein
VEWADNKGTPGNEGHDNPQSDVIPTLHAQEQLKSHDGDGKIADIGRTTITTDWVRNDNCDVIYSSIHLIALCHWCIVTCVRTA